MGATEAKAEDLKRGRMEQDGGKVEVRGSTSENRKKENEDATKTIIWRAEQHAKKTQRYEEVTDAETKGEKRKTAARQRARRRLGGTMTRRFQPYLIIKY